MKTYKDEPSSPNFLTDWNAAVFVTKTYQISSAHRRPSYYALRPETECPHYSWNKDHHQLFFQDPGLRSVLQPFGPVHRLLLGKERIIAGLVGLLRRFRWLRLVLGGGVLPFSIQLLTLVYVPSKEFILNKSNWIELHLVVLYFIDWVGLIRSCWPTMTSYWPCQ